MSLALGRGQDIPREMAEAATRTPLWWWLALAPSLLLLGGGVASVAWLLAEGVQVWGNDWPVVWGFEMINYGWWLGLATGTMFISAVLALGGAVWRPAVSRIAETFSVLAIAGAGIYPILHLGRPWFFYWLAPYPNTLQLWPQFKSPLLWDFMSILTVLVASVSFWFMGMIPDMAAMRDRAPQGRRALFYGVLALGFRGSGRQWRHHRAAYATMAGLMVPLVISVQSIGALDFAGGEQPGWHSTQLPPMYVFIAGLQGSAMVLALALALCGPLRLRAALAAGPVDRLVRIMLVASLGLAYCYGMEAFTSLYSGDAADLRVFEFKLAGPVYYLAVALNCLAPQVLWLPALRRSTPAVVAVALGVLLGTWFEHYGTTVSSQARAELMSAWGSYAPSLSDWTLFGGTLGLVATGMLLAVRLLPMGRVWGRA